MGMIMHVQGIGKGGNIGGGGGGGGGGRAGLVSYMQHEFSKELSY